MEITANQVASWISGTVEGNPDVIISGVAKIEEAQQGMLCFLANPKYFHFIYDTQASAVIVGNDFELHHSIKPTLIRVPDPYASFAKILNMVQQKANKGGISSLSFMENTVKHGENLYLGAFAYVGENVVLGSNVKIYPQAYVGDGCTIDDDTVVYSGVKLYANVKVGKRCVLHSGAVIGADGFGFAPQADGHYEKVPQTGIVILDDDVEIGANTTVDRATMGSTHIHRGVKLDNQIMIAHNVEIGEDTVMAAQAGVSGSTKIGNGCIMGGQVGLAGHLHIANHVTIGAQSGVPQSLETEGQAYMGTPAMPLRECQRVYIHTRNLDALAKQVAALEKKLKDLESNK